MGIGHWKWWFPRSSGTGGLLLQVPIAAVAVYSDERHLAAQCACCPRHCCFISCSHGIDAFHSVCLSGLVWVIGYSVCCRDRKLKWASLDNMVARCVDMVCQSYSWEWADLWTFGLYLELRCTFMGGFIWSLRISSFLRVSQLPFFCCCNKRLWQKLLKGAKVSLSSLFTG